MPENKTGAEDIGMEIAAEMIDIFKEKMSNLPPMSYLDFVSFHGRIISAFSLALISGMEYSLEKSESSIDAVKFLDAVASFMKGVYLKHKNISNEYLMNIDMHENTTIN